MQLSLPLGWEVRHSFLIPDISTGDHATIMDSSLGTNLHFWCFCAHARREYHFICQTSPLAPHPPPPPKKNLKNTTPNFSYFSTIDFTGQFCCSASSKPFQIVHKLKTFTSFTIVICSVLFFFLILWSICKGFQKALMFRYLASHLSNTTTYCLCQFVIYH